MSLEECVERFADRADTHELAFAARLTAIGGIDVRFGHDAAAEPHLRGLAHAQRCLRRASDFARKADLADAIAARTPRSDAGSSTVIPPAMFTNTSSPIRFRPARFSRTASSSERRCWSMPLAVRRAVP